MAECCICGNKDDGIVLSYKLSKFKLCKKCNEYKKAFDISKCSDDCIKTEAVDYFLNIIRDREIANEVNKVLVAWDERLDYLHYEVNQAVEISKQEYARSFNENYEYDVVTIINENHGMIDKAKMMKILSDHAKKGWRLHTMYSNELGTNALSIMGFGTNATACEDVMIFERRVQNLEE